MYKACSRCGKIHDYNYKCNVGRKIVYRGGEERQLRQTNAWKEKSKEIRECANNLCEVCRREGAYTYNNLEVHHIVKIRDDKSLYLDNDNLICLCQFHHRQAEKGYIDADYLRSIAKERERRRPPV